MGVFDAYDEQAKGIVKATYNVAKEANQNPVDIPHLFFVLINQTNNAILSVIQQAGINVRSIKERTNGMLFGLLSIQDNLSASEYLQDIFSKANTIAKERGLEKTDIYSIFLSILKSDTKMKKMLAEEEGITYEKIERVISYMTRSHGFSEQKTTSQNISSSESNEKIDPTKYMEDLTQQARDGKLRKVIGREKDFKKMIEILGGKEKNNVLILGGSGVGKTAVVEMLAQKIGQGEVPEFLKHKKIMKINLGSLMAGSKFRGEFEERIMGIINTVKESHGEILLFIDEFHNVSGAGKTEGSMDMGEILKPELSSGNIQVIGATTTDEYQLNLEKNTALVRRFGIVKLSEISVQDSITILRGIESTFEQHHGVKILDTALTAAVELSNRYIKDRKLPDKAISVLDQAATKVKIAMTSLPDILTEQEIKIGNLVQEKNSLSEEVALTNDSLQKEESKRKVEALEKQIKESEDLYKGQKKTWENIQKMIQDNKGLSPQISEKIYKELGVHIKDTVDKEDIAQVISDATGIPLTKMFGEESEKLLHLEDYLSKKVIGQSEAISAISNAIRRARAGLKDPKKPIGSFLFLGSTGVGKTELAKALAEFLFQDKNALVRLNMSEYKDESSASKLIGSAPGLIGSEKGGQLTEAIKRKPYSVILLDEVEKAHQSVFDLFLQVFDDGILNDSLGNTIDFKNTVIIMTSNIGSHEIMEKLQGSQEVLGDIYSDTNSSPNEKQDEKIQEQLSKTEELREELQPMLLDFFRPEFINRLDADIIFNPISPEMLRNILDIKLKEKTDLIYANNKIQLTFPIATKNFLAKKSWDPANGARPIDRALQKYLIDPISKEIIAGDIKGGETREVGLHDNALTFQKKKE